MMIDGPAYVFVAEDGSGFDVGAAFVHMEVRAADVCNGEPDDGVGGLLDLCVGDLVDAYFTWAVIDESFHVGILSRR